MEDTSHAAGRWWRTETIPLPPDPPLPSQVFSESLKLWRAQQWSDPLPQERILNLIFRNPNSLLHSRGSELRFSQPKRGWSAPPTTLEGRCTRTKVSFAVFSTDSPSNCRSWRSPTLQRSQRVLLAQDPGRQDCKYFTPSPLAPPLCPSLFIFSPLTSSKN